MGGDCLVAEKVRDTRVRPVFIGKGAMTVTSRLMLVPSLACPASCAYCFGPHEGWEVMRQETVEAVVRWQSALGGDEPLEITFHGGEPLVPGIDFYRMALPLLRDGLSPRPVRFAMQSNLWLLTDELAELLREHDVSIGTSLDGPEAINWILWPAIRGLTCIPTRPPPMPGITGILYPDEYIIRGGHLNEKRLVHQRFPHVRFTDHLWAAFVRAGL